MPKPFREHHLFQLLQGYEEQSGPLDLFISLYFRANKALGSKDRGFIAEAVYALVRWRGMLDYFCEPEKPTWERRVQVLQEIDIGKLQDEEEIPLHIRLSFPKELFDLVLDSHGIENGSEICLTSNYPAPTTVRANLLKTTRSHLLEQWKDIYQVEPCKFSETGIIFRKKINFFDLPEFKAGLFEVQDEGSQLLANLVEVKAGQIFLDYCAGSGGKTLAIAPKMQEKGQIYLHDIRSHALLEARKRLKRAGIQNGQALRWDEEKKLKSLKKKCDWVLVDAPCTGTGTLRRNPDMKWKFTVEAYERLVGQQRAIFEKALSFVKPGGHIVYATCSVLTGENQKQVEHFLKTYPLELLHAPLVTLPSQGGMDGFFGAVFRTHH